MLKLKDDRVGVVFCPDYVDYHGIHYLDSVVSFLRGSVEVNCKTIYGKEETFHVHLEIEDIIKIESQWSAQYEAGTINIYFISKDATQSETVYASGIKELKFPAVDANWYKKQEAIESLDVRYKALWNALLDTRTGNSSAFPDGKDMMLPRSYFPNFEKPFEEVIYPKGDPDAVSISKRDIDLLRPDTFVNDTIIDFYIKYLKTRQTVEAGMKFHFFNSFFFRKLADMDKDPSSAFDGKAAFQRVRKWTRKVNLPEKDFIFIPINYNYHWSLVVICYFGEVAGYEDAKGEKSARVPCILHMDSIRGSHVGLKDLMQSYLWEEWKERQKETREDLYLKFRNLKFVSLELPQQQNSYDCGLFLLHYVELFLEDVPANFSIYKITSSSKFLQADWFPPGEASMKRAHIERLIDDLLDTYPQECSSSDGSDVHCSPDGLRTTFDNENEVGLPESSCHLRASDTTSQCSDAGEGIEMSLLPTPSIRSTECTRSTGLVLKELFDSGSAAESFVATPWGSFGNRESLTEFRQLPPTEEEVECFVQRESTDPAFQDVDEITTASPVIHYAAAEFKSDPDRQASLGNNDSSPVASGCGSDNVSGLKADGKGQSLGAVSLDVELDKPRCMSAENVECSTICFIPYSGETFSDHLDDSVNNLPDVYPKEESHLRATCLSSGHHSTNFPAFASDDNLGILEDATPFPTVRYSNYQAHPCTIVKEESPVSSHQSNCVQVGTVDCEPLPESGEQHTAKRMRICPPDGGEELASNLSKDLHL